MLFALAQCSVVTWARIAVLSTIACQLSARVFNSSLSGYFMPKRLMGRVTRNPLFPYGCTVVAAILIRGLSVPSLSSCFLIFVFGTIQLLILWLTFHCLSATLVSRLVPKSYEELEMQFPEGMESLITVEEFRKMENEVIGQISLEGDMECRITKYMNGDEDPLKEVAEVVKKDVEKFWVGESGGKCTITMAQLKYRDYVYFIPPSSDEEEDTVAQMFLQVYFYSIFIRAICERKKLSKLNVFSYRLYQAVGKKFCFVMINKRPYKRFLNGAVNEEFNKIRDDKLVGQLVDLASVFAGSPWHLCFDTSFLVIDRTSREERVMNLNRWIIGCGAQDLKSMILGEADGDHKGLIALLQDPSMLGRGILQPFIESGKMTAEELNQAINRQGMHAEVGNLYAGSGWRSESEKKGAGVAGGTQQTEPIRSAFSLPTTSSSQHVDSMMNG